MRNQLLTDLMVFSPIQPATNYWRAREIEEVVRYGLPGGRGLDLGCGDGILMSILSRHSGLQGLTGIDVDPQETALAAKSQAYTQVVTGPADRLPFATGTFDYVFSNSVLEHIPDIDSVLAEVARVLRPMGRFLFTVPGPDFHRCLRGPRFGSRERYLRATDARCAHLRYWNSEEWEQHLEAVGLKTIHQHGYLTLEQVRRWESLARHTSGLLYHLFRSKKQPIEIQRMAGIRTSAFRLPRFLATIFATVMNRKEPVATSFYGCLLVEATRLA